MQENGALQSSEQTRQTPDNPDRQDYAGRALQGVEMSARRFAGVYCRLKGGRGG